MKKSLYTLFISLAIASCSQNETLTAEGSNSSAVLEQAHTSTSTNEVQKHDICTEMYLDSETTPQTRLALEKAKLWDTGQSIKVRFLEGNRYVQQKVIQYAREWEQYANLRFDFVSSGEAEIRIGFDPEDGSWSYIGKDALGINENEPTMNYDRFNKDTPEEVFKRITLHEFGHALGIIHEHQNPDVSIPWDTVAVYQYYYDTAGWDKEKVDHNVFDAYDQAIVTNSQYDPESIMHYYIPNSLTVGDFEVGYNEELSDTDKRFIAATYPRHTDHAAPKNQAR